MDLAAFRAGIKAFKGRIRPAVLDLQSQAFERVSTDIANGTPDETPPTPYKTGYARANWMPSIDTPSGALLPEFHAASLSSGSHRIAGLHAPGVEGMEPDEAALASIQRLPGFISALRETSGYHVAMLTNNVGYITQLERGTSKQAPHGFAHLAVSAVRNGTVTLRKTDEFGTSLGPSL